MTIQNIIPNREALPIPLQGSPSEAAGEVRPTSDVAEFSMEATAAQDTIGSADELPGQGTSQATQQNQFGFCGNCGLEHGLASKAVGQSQPAQANVSGTSEVVEIDGQVVPDLHEVAFGGESGDAGDSAGHTGDDGHLHAAGDAGGETEEDAGPGVEDPASKSISGETLSDDDQKEVERLRERDREVRTHEQAHAAAGGSHVRGGIKYEYQTGPDGRRYAVGGEVSIDTSPVPGDPQKTIQKAQQVRRAALAPAEPSGADRQAAAAASRMEAEARQELIEEKANPELSDETTDALGEATSDAPDSSGVAAPESASASPSAAAASPSPSPPSEDADSDRPERAASAEPNTSLDPPSAEPDTGIPGQASAPEITAPSIEPPDADPEDLGEIVEEIQDKVENGSTTPAARIVSLSYAASSPAPGGLVDYTT